METKADSVDRVRKAVDVQENKRCSEDLFEEHFDAIRCFVARRVANRDDVDDIVAETFAAALGAKPSKGEALVWLYGIARRKIADHYRRDRKPAPTFQVTVTDPEQAAQLSRLRSLVDALPKKEREALLLQSLEDLSVEEVAKVVGRSRLAVKATLQRARARLRKLAPDYFEAEVNQ